MNHVYIPTLFAFLISISALAQFPSVFDLADLDGKNGFYIPGINPGEDLGLDCNAAGDFNNDGIDDFIVSAHWADINGSEQVGKAYVVFGSVSGFSNPFDLNSLDGANGFVFHGIGEGDFAGAHLDGLGDVNGDGIDDIGIIGTQASSNVPGNRCESYVIFGSNQPFAPVFELNSLDGNNGFKIRGASGLNTIRGAIRNLGDINGDNLNDIIIGVSFAEVAGNSVAGKTYVIFGSDEGFDPILDTNDLDGISGFTLNGIDSSDWSGESVNGAGDFNNDGFNDIIIGAKGADPNGNASGEVYLVYGKSSGFSPQFSLSELDGNNGFIIRGALKFDLTGWAVSGGGDINGDGIDDIIMGIPEQVNSTSGPGGAAVIYGTTTPTNAILNLNELDGSDGFKINGVADGDFTGSNLDLVDDVNGDDIDDIIIAARYASQDGIDSAGACYLIFGNDAGFPATFELSSLDGTNGFAFKGRNPEVSDQFGIGVGSAGDVNDDGINDLILGAWFKNSNGISNSGEAYVIYNLDSYLGIFDEDLNKSDFFILPNPNIGEFSLDYNGTAKLKSLNILDATGRLIKKIVIDNFYNKQQFKVNLQSGVYLFNLITDQSIVSKRIVIE